MSLSSLKLEGKVALITGAGSGIGAATAILFTKLGASIAILGTTQSKLENTIADCDKVSVGQPKPFMFVGNIKENDVRQKIINDTVKTFGKLDILVNNAGINIAASVLGSPIDVYDEVFDVNLRSVIILTQLAAPHLIKTKGSIVNISSIATQRVSSGRMYYSMSKLALNQFTKFLAQELGIHQVRANSVSPGLVRTNFPMNYGFHQEELKEYYDKMNSWQVLGRAGEASEIASMIAYLASDEASFVTGADFVVDGGFLASSGITPPTSKN